jgi:hypothetical protein
MSKQKWTLTVSGVDVSCDTGVSWTCDFGRDDSDDICQPGRLSVTLHKYGADRAAWINARDTVQLSVEVAGVKYPVFTGRVAQVTRDFKRVNGESRNDVRLDCTGPLADAARASLPMGPAGAYNEMPDGWRVATVLAQAKIALSAARPESGHFINDEFPDHNSYWAPATDVQTTGSGPLTWTRAGAVVNLNKGETVEVQVTFHTDHPCIVEVNLAGNKTSLLYSQQGTHTAIMSLPIKGALIAPYPLTVTFTPVDDTKTTGLTWDKATGTWDAWTPATQTWVMTGMSSGSMTVSLLNIDAWRKTWDGGSVWLTRREPVEQSVLDHIHDIENTGVGVLWETRDGVLTWQSLMSRKGAKPSIDMDACYVWADSESTELVDGIINDVTVMYDYPTIDNPRPSVTRTDQASVALYGLHSKSIDGPIRDQASALAIANFTLATHAHPRERTNVLRSIPLSQIPDHIVQQIAKAPLGSMMAVDGIVEGWVVTGSWYAYLEGMEWQGKWNKDYADAEVSFRLSDVRDNPYTVTLPSLSGPAWGDRPASDIGGGQGPQGPKGDGLQILSAVAIFADLPTTGNHPGDAHLVTATGDLYVWGVDGTWHDLGHVVGPPGPQGPQGVRGPQGIAGPRGDGIRVLGAVATKAGLPATASPGDAWITVDTSLLWIWDGTAWKSLDHIAGPQGQQGIQGTQGVQGVQGPAGTGLRFLSAVADATKLPATGQPGDTHLVISTGNMAVWDGTKWLDVGHIQGPTGPQGVQGIQGPQGPQGPVGRGIHVLSAVAAVTDLPTTGNREGDAHLVTATGNLHIWEGGAWVELGHIQGPQGPSGAVGPAGPAGTGVHVWVQLVAPTGPTLKQGDLWVIP